MIDLKRIYEPKTANDGFRILVDRLWPRGVSKQKAGLDLWLKDIAPSNELREWFAHEPKKWPEFQKRYREELSAKTEQLTMLRNFEKEHGKITLLYAARDEGHNEAVVIAEVLTLQAI